MSCLSMYEVSQTVLSLTILYLRTVAWDRLMGPPEHGTASFFVHPKTTDNCLFLCSKSLWEGVSGYNMVVPMCCFLIHLNGGLAFEGKYFFIPTAMNPYFFRTKDLNKYNSLTGIDGTPLLLTHCVLVRYKLTEYKWK